MGGNGKDALCRLVPWESALMDIKTLCFTALKQRSERRLMSWGRSWSRTNREWASLASSVLNHPPAEDVHPLRRHLRNTNTDFSGCTMIRNGSTNNKVVPLFFTIYTWIKQTWNDVFSLDILKKGLVKDIFFWGAYTMISRDLLLINCLTHP